MACLLSLPQLCVISLLGEPEKDAPQHKTNLDRVLINKHTWLVLHTGAQVAIFPANDLHLWVTLERPLGLPRKNKGKPSVNTPNVENVKCGRSS
ncbi:uncharacterized protein PgNI_08571 [Pyricularia grisea]|uniref:Secreted protein n=1 Tax=Pyricularia grisea TaxID=148305 RepID=A0A6P8AWT4_PYRGI|nr:uncharacterized protein PgNI_08571 [Pyricularia grisea]TLD06634.1 hypothetical protein PgNI_08571 [Pyricularia grisea]